MKPIQGPLAKLAEKDFVEFIFLIGSMAYRAPAAAAFARHTSPLNTVRDYLDSQPGDSHVRKLATEFWRDLAGKGALTTDEFCRKWYGKSGRETQGDVSAEFEAQEPLCKKIRARRVD
jgi:hypothetical protein